VSSCIFLPVTNNNRPAFSCAVLHDGQNLFDGRTFLRTWHGLARRRLGGCVHHQRPAEPMIIVGIYNIGKTRISEYTPTKVPKLGGGRADRYGNSCSTNLMPFIQDIPNRTRLRPHRHWRLIARRPGKSLSLACVCRKYLEKSPRYRRRSGGIIASSCVSRRPVCGTAPAHLARRRYTRRTRIVDDVEMLRGRVDAKRLAPRRESALPASGKAPKHNEAAWAQRVGPFLEFLFPAG